MTLDKIRWNGVIQCPYCKSFRVKPGDMDERRHRCGKCNKPFTATTKTIFHHSHVPFDKWLIVMGLYADYSITHCATAAGLQWTTVKRMIEKLKASENDPLLMEIKKAIKDDNA